MLLFFAYFDKKNRFQFAFEVGNDCLIVLCTGGYAYIDSRQPHFAGSRAAMTSEILPATDPESGPKCFVFWVHMFGAGIGRLRCVIEHLVGGNQFAAQTTLVPQTLFHYSLFSSGCFKEPRLKLTVGRQTRQALRTTRANRHEKFGVCTVTGHVIRGTGPKSRWPRRLHSR